MNRFILLPLLSYFISTSSYAQVVIPQLSPVCRQEQKIGLSSIGIEYSRPSAKGRKVFGQLVPYNKVWRTGANSNTVIDFSDDVFFGSTEIKAGKYSLYTIPSENQWKIMLYKTTDNWGVPTDFNEAYVLASETVVPKTLSSFEETFTILLSNLKPESVTLKMSWENTEASVEIGLPTDKKTMASIEETMKSPDVGYRDYYLAAEYYLNTNRDLKQAKQWIDKSVELSSNTLKFWILQSQAVIYYKIGDKSNAIKILEKSSKLAEKEGNQEYIKLNKKLFEEWK